MKEKNMEKPKNELTDILDEIDLRRKIGRGVTDLIYHKDYASALYLLDNLPAEMGGNLSSFYAALAAGMEKDLYQFEEESESNSSYTNLVEQMINYCVERAGDYFPESYPQE